MFSVGTVIIALLLALVIGFGTTYNVTDLILTLPENVTDAVHPDANIPSITNTSDDQSEPLPPNQTDGGNLSADNFIDGGVNETYLVNKTIVNNTDLVNNTVNNAHPTNASFNLSPANITAPPGNEPNITTHKINVVLGVRDHKGYPLNARITSLDNKLPLNRSLRNLKVSTAALSEVKGIDAGIYEIEVIPEEHPVKKITFHSVNITHNGTFLLGLDDVPEEKVIRTQRCTSCGHLDTDFVNVYAIDPTGFNFTSATVTVTAAGTELYKCQDWNFTTQTCEGAWELFKPDLIPGQEYTFTLTPEDPGFGEIFVTAAQHLDENGTFISDVYDEVMAKDGVWSEPIYANHIVRVTYHANLSNGNVIDVFVRNTNLTWFDVYVANTTTPLVGSSGVIDSAAGTWVYITVANLTEPTDNFDFRIQSSDANGFLEFDYIHDDATPPVINSIADSPDPVRQGDIITIQANVTDDVNVDSVWVTINGTNYTMSGITDNAITYAEHLGIDVTSDIAVQDEVFKVYDMADSNKRLYLNFSYNLVDQSVLHVNATKKDGFTVGIYAQSDTLGSTPLGTFTVTSATPAWYNVTLDIATPTNAIWLGKGTGSGDKPKENIDYIYATSDTDLWEYAYDTSGLSIGLYNYTVYAKDTSNKNATPQTGNFTVKGPATGSPSATLSFFMSSEGNWESDKTKDENDFDECPIQLNDYGETTEKCGLWKCTGWENTGAAKEGKYCKGGWECTQWNGVTCAQYKCTEWASSSTAFRKLTYCSGGWDCLEWNGEYCEHWYCTAWSTDAVNNDMDRYCDGIWNCTNWNGITCDTWYCTNWAEGSIVRQDYYCAGVWDCTIWNEDVCGAWNCTNWLPGDDKCDGYYSNGWNCSAWNGSICDQWEGLGSTPGAQNTDMYCVGGWNCSVWDETRKVCQKWDCLEWVGGSSIESDYYCSGVYNCTAWKTFTYETPALEIRNQNASQGISSIAFSGESGGTVLDPCNDVDGSSSPQNISTTTPVITIYNPSPTTTLTILLEVEAGTGWEAIIDNETFNVTADATDPGAVSTWTSLKPGGSWGTPMNTGVTVAPGAYKDLYLAFMLKGSGTGNATISVLAEV